MTSIDWKSPAMSLFNETWTYIDMEERTPDQEQEMLANALGSMACWWKVGTDRNFSISHWQVSRVYALLSDPDNARTHGERALSIARDADLGPFYVGYGYEALARAASVAGDPSLARRHLASATAQAGKVAEAENRALLDADLAEIEQGLPGAP